MPPSAQVSPRVSSRRLPNAPCSRPRHPRASPWTSTEQLFDFSRLHEVPQVPQFDLPRYEPPRGVPARVKDLIVDPQIRSQMHEYIDKGHQNDNAGDMVAAAANFLSPGSRQVAKGGKAALKAAAPRAEARIGDNGGPALDRLGTPTYHKGREVLPHLGDGAPT